MFLLEKGFSKFLIPILTIAATLYIIGIAKYGLGLTSDSISYWASAESLYLNKNLYLPFRREYLSDWPPFFSIILSTGYFLKSEYIFSYYGFLNAAIYILVVYNFSKLAFRLTESKLLCVLSTIVLIISPPVYKTFSYLWSEPAFILITLLFIINLNQYVTHQARRFFYLSLILASLSALTRYVGVINLALAGLIILFFTNGNQLAKFKKCIVFVALSSFPLILWLFRNYAINSTLTGSGRTTELTNVTYTVLQFANACWEWFLPPLTFRYGGVITFLVTALVFTILIIKILIAINLRVKQWRLLLILLIYTISHLAIVLMSAMLQSSDAPNYRLTAPAFVTFLLLITYSVKFLPLSSRYTYKAGFFLVLCLIITYNLFAYLHYIKRSREAGVLGYSDLSTRSSELIKAAKSFDASLYTFREPILYSNFAEKLYVNDVYGVYRVTGGPKGRISENFKKRTDYKIVIWFGDLPKLRELVETHLPEYDITKVSKYNDGVIVTLALNER
ncbi:hypothetical protein [uncultured Pontibacter sp.]|uniref:hypothetical protein n=1 Tax=uncultured Pontibacter sp. TaxID=453356 RepID=UPI00261D1A28|nr:hypothetical protein [uncultured Pontibacter sp.]